MRYEHANCEKFKTYMAHRAIYAIQACNRKKPFGEKAWFKVMPIMLCMRLQFITIAFIKLFHVVCLHRGQFPFKQKTRLEKQVICFFFVAIFRGSKRICTLCWGPFLISFHMLNSVFHQILLKMYSYSVIPCLTLYYYFLFIIFPNFL